MTPSKKDCTAAIQKSIETGERFPLSFFDSRKYIQHNLNLEDGFAPILKFMDSLPTTGTQVDVRCAFEDGDYSVALADYVLGDWGAMVGFEVHRWEAGKIVEHWDNLQPSAPPNASGRRMADGDFGSADFGSPEEAATAENKQLVERFARDVLIGGKRESLATFFHGDVLTQHSPRFGDGVASWRQSLDRRDGAPLLVYGTLHKVLGQGPLVLTLVEGTIDDAPASFYDLYRVQAGKLAEHWEVIETLPPRDQWKNDNGKF